MSLGDFGAVVHIAQSGNIMFIINVNVLIFSKSSLVMLFVK